MKHFLFRRPMGAILLLLVLFGMQCEKETATPDEQSVNTTSYFEQAIRWNAQHKRWEFFNWKGTDGPNGCRIRVNVHDDTDPFVPVNATAYRPQLLEDAVRHSVRMWSEVLNQRGVPCTFQLRFARKKETLFTSFPRLDIYYEYQVDDGNSCGLVGAGVDLATRKLNRVRMHIAQRTRNFETLSADSYLSTLAHEMGHALGIYRFGGGSAHSSDKNDVMYSPSKYWRLSNGDILTMQEVYTREPFYKP